MEKIRYFCIDEVCPSGEEELYEYETEEEFIDYLLENRFVAEDCGDEVASEEEVKELLKEPYFAFHCNAFTFIKGTQLLKDYGYENI